MEDRFKYVLNDLKKACKDHGSQAQFSRFMGLSKAYINDMLLCRRPLTDQVLAAIGWKRIITYQRVKFGVKPK